VRSASPCSWEGERHCSQIGLHVVRIDESPERIGGGRTGWGVPPGSLLCILSTRALIMLCGPQAVLPTHCGVVQLERCSARNEKIKRRAGIPRRGTHALEIVFELVERSSAVSRRHAPFIAPPGLPVCHAGRANRGTGSMQFVRIRQVVGIMEATVLEVSAANQFCTSAGLPPGRSSSCVRGNWGARRCQ
jgi:hypothetical protein